MRAAQRLDDSAAGGVADMQDAAARMGRLQSQREGAVLSPVEMDAEPLQRRDRGRPFLGDPAGDLRVGQAGAGGDRVLGLEMRGIVRADSRGQPALGPAACGLLPNRHRVDQHSRMGRQGQRGDRAGDAATDNDGASPQRLGREFDQRHIDGSFRR